MTVTRWPRFQAQLALGVPTGGEDCAIRAMSVGIDYATEGWLRPTVADLRERAGVAGGGLTTGNIEKAVESYDSKSETHGYPSLHCRRVLDEPWSEAVDALKAGQYVILFVNYGWLNDHRPELSGDPAYRGTHAIGLLGYRVKDGANETRRYDSVCDARRSGIPKDPTWVRLNPYRLAAREVIGVDGWRGGIIPFRPR